MTSESVVQNDTHECQCTNQESLFLPREAKILHTHQPTSTEKHFTLQFADGSPLRFQPGQILEVGVMGYGEIPIGIASSPTRTNTFEIVVRKVGRVSTAINNKQVGDSLWVRGPLGHGFDLDALRGQDVLVVAGGIGICPTRSLIQYIADQRDDFGSCSPRTAGSGGRRTASSTTRRSTAPMSLGRATWGSSPRSSATPSSRRTRESSSAARR